MRSTLLAAILLIPPMVGCAHAESETEARPWGASGTGGGPSRPPSSAGGADDGSVLRDAGDPGAWPDVGTRDVAASGGASGQPASGGSGGGSAGASDDDGGAAGGSGGSAGMGGAGGASGTGGSAGPGGMAGAGGSIPTSWACRVEYYDEGVVGYCDCGCGAPDPDCVGGCTDPGCSDAACDYCHDLGGADVACVGGTVWTCPPQHYDEGASQYCDCGCGKPDPDCGGGGCTQPECYDPACMYCHAVTGSEIPCGP